MIFSNFDDVFSPKSIKDIVFPDNNSQDLINDLVNGYLPFPVREGKCGVLLHGIPGTGKSALAKLLPDAIEMSRTGRQANEQYIHVQPGNNGLTLLQRLASLVSYVPLNSYHYTVLDEVDNLNVQAMAMLKSIMNTPLTVWILTTNRYQSIEEGIRSRCHCVTFNAAEPESWLPLAHRMLAHAGVTGIKDTELIDVINTGDGSAREIITAIAQVAIKAHRLNQPKTYA
tara:strand:+ start:1671 stop:2354 length:684 start_codon:yes stop_codon:yes gene_type:complete